ncbi:hypothetical protein VTO73DRAFT_6265 [Trametes versicolor]
MRQLTLTGFSVTFRAPLLLCTIGNFEEDNVNGQVDAKAIRANNACGITKFRTSLRAPCTHGSRTRLRQHPSFASRRTQPSASLWQ